MLIAVTELRTKDEIDTFVKKAGELNGSKSSPLILKDLEKVDMHTHYLKAI